MSLAFTYSLNPPASVDAAVPKSGTESFTVTPNPASARSETEAFYNGAAPALRDMQARLMEVLTAWKDAAGDSEKHLENTGKVAKGQGKAARMMAANKAAEAAASESEEESSEDE